MIIPGKRLYIKNLGKEDYKRNDLEKPIFSDYSIKLDMNEEIIGALNYNGESDSYVHICYNERLNHFSIFKIFVEEEILLCRVP